MGVIPIRKTASDKVSLTSYYGKVFISRSDAAVDNYSKWLNSRIGKYSLDASDRRVVRGKFGSNPIPTEIVPRDYSAIMASISGFTTGEFTFTFEYKNIPVLFSEETNVYAKKNKLIPCGNHATLGVLYYGLDNIVYTKNKDGKLLSHGNMIAIIGGDWGRVPVDQVIVSIFGKKIPMGLLLGRYLGISKVLKDTKAKFRKVPANIRTSAESHEFAIKFKDITLFVDKTNPDAAMIMSGYLAAKKQTPLYNFAEFEEPNVYSTLFLGLGIHTLAIREMQLLRDAFVDNITEEILVDMKEPTTVVGLFYRAVELLRNDKSPDETDPSLMRIRGYERIGGFMYKAFVDAARVQRGSPNPSDASLDIRINSVWQLMVGDATTQLAQVINPTHSLKEQEGVSQSGEGGRQAPSLVKRTRVFHKDDVGIFSESVPDSAKVAIRSFLTPNAAIDNVRGIMGTYDPKRGTAGVLSTSSNILPASNHDDKVIVVNKSL